jgi:hypothetical protein
MAINARTHARTHGLMIFQTFELTVTHTGRRRLQGRRLLPHRAITSGRTDARAAPMQSAAAAAADCARAHPCSMSMTATMTPIDWSFSSTSSVLENLRTSTDEGFPGEACDRRERASWACMRNHARQARVVKHPGVRQVGGAAGHHIRRVDIHMLTYEPRGIELN